MRYPWWPNTSRTLYISEMEAVIAITRLVHLMGHLAHQVDRHLLGPGPIQIQLLLDKGNFSEAKNDEILLTYFCKKCLVKFTRQ